MIERTVLLLFTIYNISILNISARMKWEMWVSVFILASLLASWIIYAGRYKDYHFRAVFVTIMMQVTMCLYAMNVKRLYEMLPFFAAFVVGTGLYGMADLMPAFYGSVLFMFFYHMVIAHRIPYHAPGEVQQACSQLFNMLLIVFLVHFWLKKREEASAMAMKTIEDLREAQRSKDDFLANVSHEIRTPINTICGMSEVVLQEENFEKIRENVHYIQTAGRNLMSVVSDILDFSELQSGKLEKEEEAYNITSTINDIINMTLAKMKDKKTELIVDCDATLPCSLFGDEKKIRRVIMNLLDNAVKFTEEGGVSFCITYRKEAYGINLIITVRDTGIGMKEESLEKLFYSFSQVDTKRNRQKGGMGLGLAISRAIIQLLGGVITVKSKPGKGTMVKCVIPQKVLDEKPIVSLKRKEDLNIGIYADLEQFTMMEIRDEYTNNIRHMIEQMQVRSHVCRNLSELKRRNDYEKFTHIFISIEEYIEEPAYFDELALQTKVIVILSHSDESKLTNPNLLRIYKPFYILPIVFLLNGEMTNVENIYFSKKARMIAPQANVLVVDDNLMNLKVMEGVLEKYRLKVSTALSGKEALEKIESKIYDLVFMDHMMPEMDGVETLHHIREKTGSYFKAVPIVALTANAIAGAREMFLSEGFTDFLEKPVEISVLQRVLIRNLPKNKVYFIEEQKEEAREEQKEEQEKKQKEEQTEEQKEKQEETKMMESEAKKTENTNMEEELVIGDLDVETGILYCGGKTGYLEILKLCRDTIQENQKNTEELFAQENWKEYIITVHGIKSSMLSIGALKLSELAKGLELAGKAENFDYIRENHNIMMEEYKRVGNILLEHPLFCTEKETQEKEQELPKLEETVFQQKCDELEKLMYELDEEGMLAVLTELQQYQYCKTALQKPLETIVRKVKMSDYMSAVEKTVKLKEELEKNSERR